jgi:hypothetical protein
VLLRLPPLSIEITQIGGVFGGDMTLIIPVAASWCPDATAYRRQVEVGAGSLTRRKCAAPGPSCQGRKQSARPPHDTGKKRRSREPLAAQILHVATRWQSHP